MSRSLSPSLSLCTLVVLGAVRVRADEPTYGAAARVRVPFASAHTEDASAAGTNLDLTKRLSLPLTLTDVVRELPGANVLATGGIGAYASVALRGADGEETSVMLDDIPLTTPEGGPFDLSTFPPTLFSSIDVFRGGAPVWLGQGAIGGVLRLNTRREPTSEAQAGVTAGSFGTGAVQGRASVVRPSGLALHSNVYTRHTNGDYPYVDDSDPSAHVAREVRNGQLDEASGFVDAEVPLGPGALRVFGLANARTGGVPGPGSTPSPRVHRASSRMMLATAYTIVRGARHAPRERLQVLWSGAYGNNRYTDLYGQLGLSRQTASDDLNLRSFTRLVYERRIGRFLSGTLLGTYAYDRYEPENVYQFPPARPSDRHGVAGSAELVFHARVGPINAELRPSGRVELAQTTLHARTSLNDPFVADERRVVPTVRLGFVIGAYGFLSLSTSAATGTRLPSMYELFGDRGVNLPSLELAPVRATTYDLGLTATGTHGPYTGTLQSYVFTQQRENSIVLVGTGQQAIFENLYDTTQRGIESGLSGSYREVARLTGAFTVLDAQTELGKRLPLRPRYVASLTPQVLVPLAQRVLSSAGSSLTLNHRSYVFTDIANLVPVPRCTTVSISASLGFLSDRIRFTARVDDVADARCKNLLSYPLPGRAVFFSVSYEEKSDASAT